MIVRCFGVACLSCLALQNMSCMSDVDLATLHKCRLDQRIKYALSDNGWVNRRAVAAVKTKCGSRIAPDTRAVIGCRQCGCAGGGGGASSSVCCRCDDGAVASRGLGQRGGGGCDLGPAAPASDATTSGDKRKVGSECKQEQARDKEPFLTRRRSGTWP